MSKAVEVLMATGFAGGDRNVVRIVFSVHGAAMELEVSPFPTEGRETWRGTVSRFYRDGRGWVEVLRDVAITGVPHEGASCHDPRWSRAMAVLAESVIRITDGD